MTLSAASLRRRAKAADLKRRSILLAAREIFSRVGFAGASLEQVAAAAGTSKTNVIYYFVTKDELYLAVLDDVLALWLAKMEDLNSNADPIEALRAYIIRKIDFSRDYPEASRLFCMELLQGGHVIYSRLQKSLKPMMDSNASLIRHWISTNRIRPVDPYHLLYSIWSMTQHYADFAVQIRAVSGRDLAQKSFRDEAIDHVVQMVLGGLGIATGTLPAAPEPGRPRARIRKSPKPALD